MRLSIEVTPEQHQLLKVAVALQGESIKDFVLKRTLPDLEEHEALKKLEAFLRPLLKSAKEGNISQDTIHEIFDSILTKSK